MHRGWAVPSNRMSNPSNPPPVPAQPNFVHNPDGWAVPVPTGEPPTATAVTTTPSEEVTSALAGATPSPCYEGNEGTYRPPPNNRFLAWLGMDFRSFDVISIFE
jgi:hypothetical protein